MPQTGFSERNRVVTNLFSDFWHTGGAQRLANELRTKTNADNHSPGRNRPD